MYHFLCVFRCLATGSSFRTLGYSYRIADNTVGKIVHETCLVIWDCFQEIHMPFPSNDNTVAISNEFFRKWKFPNCVGCIDGKHIRIKNPANAGSMYRNYKQFFSIVLQALAGPDYKFICIDVGAYGKESDGGIFTNSNLSRQLENGALNTKLEKRLPGTDISLPHVVLGDEAYPLKTYLMRPYPQRNLGPEEEAFNQRLSRTRQVVECAFGIMSNKWRILQKAIEVTPDRADNIIKCICLLHNLIIDQEGIQETAMMETPPPITTGDGYRRFANLGENRTRAAAYTIRDSFKTYFVRNNNNI
uniref:DDE Tnp4 domain-containing protein n=1 Tax=Photinus pyralis TaxID=7054 RepID=A0A1Y1M573_PHOPY